MEETPSEKAYFFLQSTDFGRTSGGLCFIGLWFMVYGLLVHGLWFMNYGLWFMVNGLCFIGLWFMVY